MSMRNLNLENSIKASLLDIYTPDGVELAAKTMNGDEVSFYSNIEFIYSPLSTFSSFLGLPNRQLNSTQKQSWRNIYKNFRGWQDNKSQTRNILNAFLMIPLNIVTWPFKFTLNVVKFVAIGIPTILSCCLQELSSIVTKLYISKLSILNNSNNATERAAAGFSFAGLLALNTILVVAMLIPKALAFGSSLLLSPIKRIKEAQYAVLNIIDGYVSLLKIFLGIRVSHETKKKLVIISQILITAAMSTLVIASYGVFISLALHGLLAAGPYLATHLPTTLVNSFNTIAAAIAPVILQVTPFAIKALNILSLNMVNLLSSFTPLVTILATIPALVVVSMALGTAIATIGSGLSVVIEKFRNYWHSNYNDSNTVLNIVAKPSSTASITAAVSVEPTTTSASCFAASLASIDTVSTTSVASKLDNEIEQTHITLNSPSL
jgi:hypothetical protein